MIALVHSTDVLWCNAMFSAALAVVLTATPLLAAPLPDRTDGKSWEGRTVLLKSEKVEFARVADDGKIVEIGFLNGVGFKVISDRDGKLWLRHGPLDGWVKKDEAVLLESAEAFFTLELDKNPRNMYARVSRAVARMNRDELDRSLQGFDELIRLRSNYGPWWNNRGTLYLKKNDFDRAIENFSEALRLQDKDATAYSNRAVAWRNKGENAKALEDYTKSIDLDPKNPAARYNRGLLFVRQKDDGQAL